MPIKRAAYKAIRSDKKKRARNVSAISKIRTLTKTLTSVLSSKNKEEIKTSLRAVISALDKAAQKGIIHRKNASRKIKRLSEKVHSILSK